MGKISEKAWKNVNLKEAFINYMDGKPLQVLNLSWQTLGWRDVFKEPNWDLDHLRYRIDPHHFKK